MSPCGSSKIVEVLEYALDLCNARENGGRMLVLPSEEGGAAGHILDCSRWPDEYSQAVLARYPGCSITFMSAQVLLPSVCVCAQPSCMRSTHTCS